MRFLFLILIVLVGLGGGPSAGFAEPAPQGPKSVAPLARALAAAVVNISSSRRLSSEAAQHPAADGHGGGGSPLDKNPGGDAMAEAESLGSGFIISADGLVVTNYHVIEGADSVLVYLTDGTRLPAAIIGEDSKTDLAVLKVSAGHPLPFVRFGDSDTAQVGDWVMAIGNPFGLGGTVTMGIESARNRDIKQGPYDSFIQTDASINEGNSGGPLFDMGGKVIGINTAIIAQGEASLGIGFAIPSDLASPIIDQLVKFGVARRGWIGVDVQDVTGDIAASLGLANPRGALITDVTEAGPADGRLRPGDIITAFDGKPVLAMHDLPRLVAESAIGKPVAVAIERGGKMETVDIVVGELKGDRVSAARRVAPKPAVQAGRRETLDDLVGFALAPIDAVKRRLYDLPAGRNGLVVTSVRAGSNAYGQGLIAGMVVSEVNEQPVNTIASALSLVRTAREAGRPAVLFRVSDSSGSRYLAVRFVDEPDDGP
jgi:serine protease Do